MRAYLLTTGGLFALLAVVHVVRTIAEADQFARNPWFVVEGPGIGLLAAVIAVWSWRLLRVTRA